MKQFIVLAAVLPILLVFVAQFTLAEVRALRMSEAEEAVRSFCVEASYNDGAGPGAAESLRQRLAQVFRANPSEVAVNLSRVDDSHISWDVSFPVGDIMAGGLFMGLSKSENSGRAHMDGTIVIAPKPPEIPPPQDEAPLPDDGMPAPPPQDDPVTDDPDTGKGLE